MHERISRPSLLTKAALAATGLLLAVLAVFITGRAEAGSNFVSVSPLEGPPGTTVEITSEFWEPVAEVSISAGYTEDLHFGGPVMFGDVIATTFSDKEGRWSVEVELGKDLPVPELSGFVQFKATSDNMNIYNAGSDIATFTLIVNGQRPNGSGGMSISVSETPGLGTQLLFLSYRPVGGTAGFINRISAPPGLPTEVTFRSLPDGDFEVAAEALGGRLPVGPGLYDVRAPACGDPICEDHERLYRVQVVSIRNGAVVDVSIFFGDAETLPNGGSEPPQTGGLRWAWVLAGAGLAITGVMLTLVGAGRLRLRRPAVR